jgi:hypothetical protein
MSYQIVYPYPAVMTIDAESFKDAVKFYAKMNYNYTINSLIIKDQSRYMRADLNYYNDGKKKKVGISLFPTVWPVEEDGRINTDMFPYTPTVTYDTKEYPSTTYLEADFPRIVSTAVAVAPAYYPINPITAAPLVPPMIGSIPTLSYF